MCIRDSHYTLLTDLLTLSLPISSINSEEFLGLLEDSSDTIIECLPANHVLLGIYSNLSSLDDPDSLFDSLLAKIRDTYIFEDISSANDLESYLMISTDDLEKKLSVNIFSEIDFISQKWERNNKSKIKPTPIPLIINYKGLIGVPQSKGKWEKIIEEQVSSVLRGEMGNAWITLEDKLFLTGTQDKFSDYIKNKTLLEANLNLDLSGFEILCEGVETQLLNLEIFLVVYVTQSKIIFDKI